MMQKYIADLCQKTPLNETVYFRALPSCSKSRFVQTQVDFLGAVTYFSRPMLRLVSRLPKYEQRWPILENVVDEHGRGNFSHHHKATFLSFLKSLGVSEVASDPPSCVLAFNRMLDGVSICGDWREGLAVFGIIERRFAEISSLFARLVIDRNWIGESDLRHYGLHANLDLHHADDFFMLLSNEWLQPDGKSCIVSGLQMGNDAFLNLYDQIWRHRS